MTETAAASAAPVGRAPDWRRRCLWALPVVLPLALAVQCQDTVRDWLNDTELLARRSPLDAPAEIGGAEWRVVSLQRIATRPDGSAVALLRLEATARDAAMVTRLPCRIALVGPRGQRWLPAFLPPSEASRAIRRDGDEGKSCGPAFLSKPATGTAVAITESFILPTAAFEAADVTISLPGSRPYYLRFLHRG